MTDQTKDDVRRLADAWALEYVRPGVLLLWLNAAGAIACFGLSLFYAIYHETVGDQVGWALYLLPIGGFLSLVYFIGAALRNWESGRLTGPSSHGDASRSG